MLLLWNNIENRNIIVSKVQIIGPNVHIKLGIIHTSDSLTPKQWEVGHVHCMGTQFCLLSVCVMQEEHKELFAGFLRLRHEDGGFFHSPPLSTVLSGIEVYPLHVWGLISTITGWKNE